MGNIFGFNQEDQEDQENQENQEDQKKQRNWKNEINNSKPIRFNTYSQRVISIPPKCTTQLVYDNDYLHIENKLADKYKIGTNLDIRFKNSFNEPIGEKLTNIFRLYEKIIFGFSFNQVVKNKIPSSITSIQFGHNFNHDICQIALIGEQENIEEFILGEKFNQDVGNLSAKLKKIIFGYEFNKDVSNLPTQIEYVQFGHNFNQAVDYMPCSLKYIIFGNCFNQSVDNLPSSIEYIELYGDFDVQISYLPHNLKKIKLDQDYYEKNKSHIDNIIQGCGCCQIELKS